MGWKVHSQVRMVKFILWDGWRVDLCQTFFLKTQSQFPMLYREWLLERSSDDATSGPPSSSPLSLVHFATSEPKQYGRAGRYASGSALIVQIHRKMAYGIHIGFSTFTYECQRCSSPKCRRWGGQANRPHHALLLSQSCPNHKERVLLNSWPQRPATLGKMFK